jgi:signal transduction histidine kinase
MRGGLNNTASTSVEGPLFGVPVWGWVAAILSLVLLGLWSVSSTSRIDNGIFIKKASIVSVVPSEYAAKSVALPHVWDDENPPLKGAMRYTLEWPTGSTQLVDYALYIPRVGAKFRVLLNGQTISSQEWDTPGYADTSVLPYAVELPSSLLSWPLANNRLDIEVRGQLLRKSGLSAVVLGPRAAVLARHDTVFAWQVYATWMVAACSLLLALLSGLMWSQNHERVFGLLALASLAWALRLALTPLVNPHMPFPLWFYLHKLSFTVYCGCLYLFLWDLFNFQQGFGRKLVIGLLWVGPLWLGITTLAENYTLYRIWTGILVFVSVTTLLAMFHRARWGLDGSQRLMVVVGLVTVITGVRDFAVVQLGAPGDGDIRWMTLGSLVFMLTLAWVLVQRTSGYLQQIGDLNRDLTLRVQEKERELHSAFNHLREAERRQVLGQERQRLTRDMHDGLGSQLVQTLNVARSSGEQVNTHVITGMLNHALEELRMTLDSLEPTEGDLPSILGTLRRRIAPALEAAGIELVWSVQEVPPISFGVTGLESRGVMHLFRCLQEVFANIIKHAGANRVEVKTWANTSHVYVSVADNGKGLGAGQREGGRGLANIRMRAKELGAQVVFSNAAPGTCVELQFDAMLHNL